MLYASSLAETVRHTYLQYILATSPTAAVPVEEAGRDECICGVESRVAGYCIFLFLGFIVRTKTVQEMDTGKRSMSITQTGAGRKASVASGARGDGSADAALAKMGYASELPRNLSMLSVLGL